MRAVLHLSTGSSTNVSNGGGNGVDTMKKINVNPSGIGSNSNSKPLSSSGKGDWLGLLSDDTDTIMADNRKPSSQPPSWLTGGGANGDIRNQTSSGSSSTRSITKGTSGQSSEVGKCIKFQPT